jgi:hypothetical protein
MGVPSMRDVLGLPGLPSVFLVELQVSNRIRVRWIRARERPVRKRGSQEIKPRCTFVHPQGPLSEPNVVIMSQSQRRRSPDWRNEPADGAPYSEHRNCDPAVP